MNVSPGWWEMHVYMWGLGVRGGPELGMSFLINQQFMMVKTFWNDLIPQDLEYEHPPWIVLLEVWGIYLIQGDLDYRKWNVHLKEDDGS